MTIILENMIFDSISSNVFSKQNFLNYTNRQ